MTRTFATLCASTAILAAGLGGAAFAQSVDEGALLDRTHKGEIAVNGGARRLSGDITEAFTAAIKGGKAKNVILLIGDGMGDSEITIARNVALGAGGAFKGLDALPVTGQYTHYALMKDGKPDYVTDSAASGTAWATGTKTYNGAISVDIKGAPQTTLLQMAKKAGLATGDVSTSEIQDATPAVQVAHVSGRKCYDPTSTAEKCAENALENGGLGSISEQLLNTRPDVTLGGGRKYFDDVARAGEWKDQPLIEQARARGYQVVETLEQLQAVNGANDEQPVLGLFAPGNMPVRWMGPQAVVNGIQEQAAVTCQPNAERGAEVPTLAQMTEKAISLLSANEKGFFLQVEGASIDKQDHAANPCGQIGETVDLDEAVQVALNFAREQGDTLVIVTADHAHSSQIVYPDSKTPGFSQLVNTADDTVMAINYGNADVADDQGHTGAQLRVAAYGPGAANVTGLTDQTDLFFTMRDALGLGTETSAAVETAPATTTAAAQ
ncbi:alkaline phosphatase [Paracoccus sp. S1E-3]|uniref:alkaline phosphatase n=1 Tax=Paracoccus sp. S1E-3 TaxID=2756130 RepID=UPI0015EF9625|nr:alkaline phosphatase [Paracoccus sp. S1E-3]MBA4490620.1 alkaline phosphatase [Paracoccus sp. S1E-3]